MTRLCIEVIIIGPYHDARICSGLRLFCLLSTDLLAIARSSDRLVDVESRLVHAIATTSDKRQCANEDARNEQDDPDLSSHALILMLLLEKLTCQSS